MSLRRWEVTEAAHVGGRVTLVATTEFYRSHGEVTSQAGRVHARRGARGGKHRWPRGAGGRLVHQVTVVATSSPGVGLQCVAALTRAILRVRVPLSCLRARVAGGLPWRSLRGQFAGYENAYPYGPGAISNYAINPTPEQALRSNRAVLPARVIAALGVLTWLSVNSKKRDMESSWRTSSRKGVRLLS